MDAIQLSRLVRLRATGQKASPAKYGPGTYRFPNEMAWLLKKRGWLEIKKGRHYSYLRQPHGETVVPSFIVELMMPTKEQILELAEDAHSRGNASAEMVGECVARYYPKARMIASSYDPFTGVQGPKLSESDLAPHFEFGVPFLWNASVEWKDGIRKYFEDTKNVIAEASTSRDLFSNAPTPTDDDRYEGSLHRVEANRYERDQVARSRCISHHGTACVVCSFDFLKVYGEIGRGFIHVHHIVPISEAGGEYKVDPVRDLVPVCPNCHAVIHLSDPPLSVEEAKGLIEEAKGRHTAVPAG